jgi:tRNA (guanine-N7-)-methyltransferase
VPQGDSGTMTIGDEKPEARRGFFGRRKGHRLRSHQAALLDTLLPRLALDVNAPPPAKLPRLFPVPVDDVRFEIGFGGGEYLIAQAQAHPRTGFIGCEPFVNGMAKALAAIQARGLANIRLHLGDAVPLIDWLPTASLASVDLVYPDPWPKRRHWKRRFVQERTVADMARIVRHGGEFRFVSDIPDYAAWTLARLLRCPDFIWTAERADDWRQPWPGFVRTRYEAKAIREGRMPCYLGFRRK